MRGLAENHLARIARLIISSGWAAGQRLWGQVLRELVLVFNLDFLKELLHFMAELGLDSGSTPDANNHGCCRFLAIRSFTLVISSSV